jgi:hypothetical protein
MRDDSRILCQTPTPGRKGTRIERNKYEAVRAAILRAVPADPLGIPFAELPDRVAALLAPEVLAHLGSVSWYTTTVKLDLEVRGEIERVPGAHPQRLRRTAGGASPA